MPTTKCSVCSQEYQPATAQEAGDHGYRRCPACWKGVEPHWEAGRFVVSPTVKATLTDDQLAGLQYQLAEDELRQGVRALIIAAGRLAMAQTEYRFAESRLCEASFRRDYLAELPASPWLIDGVLVTESCDSTGARYAVARPYDLSLIVPVPAGKETS